MYSTRREPVHRKLAAGVAGGGVSGLMTIVIVWAIGQTGLNMPDEVASALTASIIIGATFGAGWLTREH